MISAQYGMQNLRELRDNPINGAFRTRRESIACKKICFGGVKVNTFCSIVFRGRNKFPAKKNAIQCQTIQIKFTFAEQNPRQNRLFGMDNFKRAIYTTAFNSEKAIFCMKNVSNFFFKFKIQINYRFKNKHKIRPIYSCI